MASAIGAGCRCRWGGSCRWMRRRTSVACSGGWVASRRPCGAKPASRARWASAFRRWGSAFAVQPHKWMSGMWPVCEACCAQRMRPSTVGTKVRCARKLVKSPRSWWPSPMTRGGTRRVRLRAVGRRCVRCGQKRESRRCFARGGGVGKKEAATMRIRRWQRMSSRRRSHQASRQACYTKSFAVRVTTTLAWLGCLPSSPRSPLRGL
mmetsp:Transcript_102353/g.305656  ORF Transcript_102353/g.305656 Transcript_102353/m.305656 type:complete len:207 (-) Transcript_102353:101-721(-)